MKTASKRAVAVQPEKEKDLSKSYSTFHYIKGAHKKVTHLLTGPVATGKMIMILIKSTFRLYIRKNFFYSAGSGWVPHLWRRSRSGWTGLKRNLI